MLKTNPPDPYYNHMFQNKKRMLEIHLQGKFLKINNSKTPLFIGGEILGKMKLGESLCLLGII